MENFKLILLGVIAVVVIGIIGYWAIFTIEPGNVHSYRQEIEQLEKRNEELRSEVAKLQGELRVLTAAQAETPPAPKPEELEEETEVSEHQTLINELQKMVSANVYLKEKSQGARVSTVQKFLNIYNDTNKAVDNDYGPGTKADVAKFQKAEGLLQDGEAGVNTFRKMIEWLKNN